MVPKNLMLGKMLHPLELAVPDLVMQVPVQKAGTWEQEDVPTPAILTSSWQSSQGRIGHLFLNISETIQPLQVDLDTRIASDGRFYDAEIYRSTQDGHSNRCGRRCNCRLDLQPS